MADPVTVVHERSRGFYFRKGAEQARRHELGRVGSHDDLDVEALFLEAAHDFAGFINADGGSHPRAIFSWLHSSFPGSFSGWARGSFSGRPSRPPATQDGLELPHGRRQIVIDHDIVEPAAGADSFMAVASLFRMDAALSRCLSSSLLRSAWKLGGRTKMKTARGSFPSPERPPARRCPE